ncbi:O154 family O-antigen polymerase [Escherichia coli]|nr:O154 family O-antigen polymerase [Escherichia coli]
MEHMNRVYCLNTTFLNPLIPILLMVAVFILSSFLYKVDSSSLVIIISTFLVISFIPLSFCFSSKYYVNTSNLSLKSFPLPYTTTIIIILSSSVEYFKLGIPLFGHGIYAEFGYPFLHHVSVMSWLLLFTCNSFKNRIIFILVMVFAFVNPLLMINRDLMLLTCFVFIFILLGKRKVSLKPILILGSIFLFVFGLIGEYRSPGVIHTVDLPFSFNYEKMPATIAWLFLYFTSSSFNMYYNIKTLGLNLYASNINVFPEPYYWSSFFDSFIFFSIVIILYFILLLSIRHYLLTKKTSELTLALYLYCIYQVYTGLFAVKVFNTHTLFVMLFLGVIQFCNILLPKKRRS